MIPARRQGITGAIITGIVLVITRLPFYQPHFYNWDATQLGLALSRFDIAYHRPHPPGYIFYVGLGKLLYLLGVSPEKTFQILATFMTGLGLWGLYLLARRFCSRAWSWAAVIAALFHPYVWAYGVVGESYAAEFAVSTWIGVLTVDAWRGNRLALLTGAALLGLGGGIRTSVTMFLSLLFLSALVRGPFTRKDRIAALLLAAAGVFAWLIPSAYNVGGLTRYMMLTRNLTMHVIAGMASPLFGAVPAFARHELHLLFVWFGVIIWPLLLPALTGLAAGLGKTTGDHSVAKGPGILLVAALWVVPAFVFYVFFFASKPGYLLTFFAPLVVMEIAACQKGAAWLEQKWGKRALRPAVLFVVTLASGLGVQAFLAPPGTIREDIGISASTISGSETILKLGLSAVRHELASNEPGSVAIVVDYSAPDWRRTMYYVDHVPVYHLMYRFNYPMLGKRVDACVACDQRTACASGQGFWTTWDMPDHLTVPLPARVKHLLILSGLLERDRLKDLIPGQSVTARHTGPLQYLVADLGNTSSLHFGPFRFVRDSMRPWARIILGQCQ